jgi:benzoyl-CoA reductase/2-hydroxyglutaryl-CoA dehydratase subunit BcrC/BadD/HgdB
VDTAADNILDAIADQYMDIGCPVMSPNVRREAMLPNLVSEFRADGVIDVILQACLPYSVERRAMKRLCDRHGTPYMALETDYSQTDKGQIETRIAAFIEQL